MRSDAAKCHRRCRPPPPGAPVAKVDQRRGRCGKPGLPAPVERAGRVRAHRPTRSRAARARVIGSLIRILCGSRQTMAAPLNSSPPVSIRRSSAARARVSGTLHSSWLCRAVSERRPPRRQLSTRSNIALSSREAKAPVLLRRRSRVTAHVARTAAPSGSSWTESSRANRPADRAPLISEQPRARSQRCHRHRARHVDAESVAPWIEPERADVPGASLGRVGVAFAAWWATATVEPSSSPAAGVAA